MATYDVKETKDKYNNKTFIVYRNGKKTTSIKGWRQTVLKPYVLRLSKNGINEDEGIKLSVIFKAVNRKQKIWEIDSVANKVETASPSRVMYWYSLLFGKNEDGVKQFNKEIKNW